GIVVETVDFIAIAVTGGKHLASVGREGDVDGGESIVGAAESEVIVCKDCVAINQAVIEGGDVEVAAINFDVMEIGASGDGGGREFGAGGEVKLANDVGCGGKVETFAVGRDHDSANGAGGNFAGGDGVS